MHGASLLSGLILTQRDMLVKQGWQKCLTYYAMRYIVLMLNAVANPDSPGKSLDNGLGPGYGA